MSDFDVIVVGARCAGAATAMLLARGGARVLVLDKSRAGTDTLSTHAIMRGGVIQLARWGVLDALRATTPVIRTTTFQYGDERIELAIKPDAHADGLYAPRRTVLDPALVESARDAGAEIRFGATVRSLLRDADGRVHGVRWTDRRRRTRDATARVVVGADGLRSLVARTVQAPVRVQGTRMTGVVYGYFRDTGYAANEWFYRTGSGAGVIPTNDGLTCVFVGVAADRFQDCYADGVEAGFHRGLRALDPTLAARIAASEPAGALMTFRGARGHLRQAQGAGWALVGDAGYFKDPITAHGITDALRDAESLAEALLEDTPGALARWEVQRDAASLELLRISDRIAAWDWSLEELKQLHLRLSRAMKAEARSLAARPALEALRGAA